MPTSLLQEAQPALATNPGDVSLFVALMQDVSSSLNATLVPTPEPPVLEAVAATTSSVVATLVAPEPKVEAEAMEGLEVVAAIPPFEPGWSTSRALAMVRTR